MALIVHMQNGGESTQMYSPFFEANLSGKTLKHVQLFIFTLYNT